MRAGIESEAEGGPEVHDMDAVLDQMGGKAVPERCPWREFCHAHVPSSDLLKLFNLDGFHFFRSTGIISAYNGNEGFDMARRERPDLIPMGLRMPIPDGFESISFLKGDPETQDIPIVAVTAQAMAEDKERCFQAGADAFVTKPIDIDIFRNTLKKFLA